MSRKVVPLQTCLNQVSKQHQFKMASNMLSCVFTFLVTSVASVLSQNTYQIPDVSIHVFKPKGIQVSIPDAPNLALFVFQGNVNNKIANNGIGDISGEVLQSTDGRWVFEDQNVQLKLGDVINYYVYASVNSVGYLKDNLSYQVSVLEDRNAGGVEPSPSSCERSVTVLPSGNPCVGQTIFEETFDTLREDVWKVQQYIPFTNPENPYMSYQRLSVNPTVSVVNGNLRILPVLQQTQPGYNQESIYTGTLDLFDGCTGSSSLECSKEASGSSILPPVVSGKISSKLIFKYGTVNIRAKLPQGDWVYPELLLEPYLKWYGNLNYASGVIKIATARGNKDLTLGVADYGNKLLYGGAIMSSKCRQHLTYENRRTDGGTWGDDFHVYSVTWTPDRITLSVDGQQWAWISLTPEVGSLKKYFNSNCSDVPQKILARGTPLAPFDENFYLSLGLAVGGITEFRDDLSSSGSPKPWKNGSPKALLHFWQHMDSWLPTWTNTELLVDYVKVVAI